MNIKINPCPKCGYKGHIIHDECGTYRIQCYNIDCWFSTLRYWGGLEPAIDEWNNWNKHMKEIEENTKRYWEWAKTQKKGWQRLRDEMMYKRRSKKSRK